MFLHQIMQPRVINVYTIKQHSEFGQDVVIGVVIFDDFKVDQLFWKRQGFAKDTNS